VFLTYANHVVLVSQMSAIDRKVHSLHCARDFVEILKTSSWRTLSELDLRDLNYKINAINSVYTHDMATIDDIRIMIDYYDDNLLK